MKKILIILFIFPCFCFAQQKKHWLDHYWLSNNLSLLYTVENKATGASIDLGRNFKYGLKLGAGFGFIQFDENTKVDIVNAYFEKSIDSKNKALFFFAKPGLAIVKKAKSLSNKLSPYEYVNKKNGLNVQIGSGIRWKIKRHSFFLNGGFNVTNFSFLTKQFVIPVNPYNPFIEEPILHTYKLNYKNIFFSLGFTL